MVFDVNGARKAGYSDTEIAGFLAPEKKFDLNAAKEAGYNDQEILSFLTKDEKPKEETSTLRRVADQPINFAQGVVSGVRMISDAFGADNPISKNLRGVEDYVGSLLSAQAQDNKQEIARILEEAKDKGVLDQVKDGFSAFMVAPADVMVQAFGTVIPTLVGGLAGRAIGLGARATGIGTGAAMGAGVSKGAIYDAVKDELAQTDMPKDQIEQRAILAQEYGGQNLDQILFGTALGGLAAGTGIERALLPGAVKNVMSKAAAKSATARGVGTGVVEGGTEFGQGFQEKVAQNVALQREGFDRPTFQGAFASGTMEGLAGVGLGAGVGALSRPQEAPVMRPTTEDVRAQAPVAPPQDQTQQTIDTTTGVQGVPGMGQADVLSAEDARQQSINQQIAKQNAFQSQFEQPSVASETPDQAYARQMAQQDARTPVRQYTEPQPQSPFLGVGEAAIQPGQLERAQGLAAQEFGLNVGQARPPVTEEDRIARQLAAQQEMDADRFKQQTPQPVITPAQAALPTPAPIPSARGIDRQTQLLGQRAGLPQIEQAGLSAQADIAGGTGQVAVPQTRFVDLTPMPPRAARQKLAALQADSPDADLNIVPHPQMSGRFAIEERVEPLQEEPVERREDRPSVSYEQAAQMVRDVQRTGVLTPEVIGAAQQYGLNLDPSLMQFAERTTPENLLVQQRRGMADEAALNAELRGGVATPEEAQRLRETGMGRPYDSIVAPRPDAPAELGKGERQRRLEAEAIDELNAEKTEFFKNLQGPKLWLDGFELGVNPKSAIQTASPQFTEQFMKPEGRYSLVTTATPEAQIAADKFLKEAMPVLKRFGLGKVGLRIVDSINGGKADGMYAQQIISLVLDSDNPMGVMRHEVIHALKELGAFTPAEWKVLSKAAKDTWINQFFDRALQDEYKAVYLEQNGNLDGFQEYLQEEAIAQAFRFFTETKPPSGMIANLMRRLNAFFEALGNFFRGQGFQNIDEMFLPNRILADIERGAIQPGRAQGREEELPTYAAKPKFSIRDYKLDIERENRTVSKLARMSQEELDAVGRDAQTLGLDVQQVKNLITTARNDKKRFPRGAGWEPLTVIGIDFKKDDNGNPIAGTESPKYQALAYGYATPPDKTKAPSKIDEPWLKKVQAKFAAIIEDIYARAAKGDKNAQNIIAHQNWYKNVAATLRKEYGAFGDVVADLLGATSPNTPVDTNWRFSIDVFRRFVRGDFNKEMQDFVQHLDAGKPASSFPSAQKIRQLSGSLYGMNSGNAMMALADVWRAIKPGQAPKARNFALNLIGQSDIATIDVWAARMLRRAANMAKAGKFKRIPTFAEQGVTGAWSADGKRITGEFGFGAEVMRRVSEDLKKKGINVSPPDLQAIAWFAEKELWSTKGWTSKTGEGGSFEENIENFPVERYIVGHAVQQGEVKPSAEAVMSAKNNVEKTLLSSPGIVGFRIKETKGLYGGTIEEAFDTEFVAEKNKFDPAKLISVVAQTSQDEKQYDFFISRVVDPNENNPNARPGVELYLKSKQALHNVMPILSEFTSRGVDGFTLAVDPRINDASGEYIGIRMQFVPEISMRWDESMREVINSPDGLQKLMTEKREQMLDVLAKISNIEEIAYAAIVDYDTLVIGKENYNAYISPNATARNIQAGEAVWFGQPISTHVEAAIKRYTVQQTAEPDRPVGDERTAEKGTPRFSLRTFESDQSALRPSPRSDAGISFNPVKEDAVSFQGSHYGKARTEVLNGAKYGQGLRGAEARRLEQSDDDRIKRRVYFYIPRANDTMPNREAGVGSYVYTQKLDNILAPGPTMGRLNKEAGGDANRFESLIVDNGYDGYAVPDYGMMVILNQDVPVNYEGTVDELQGGKKPQQKFSLRAPTTPEFKRFFGNSKITKPDGTPKVMYHGTARIIDEFIPKQANAIFVTENPEFAEIFSDDSLRFMITEQMGILRKAFKSMNPDDQLALVKKAYKLGVKQKGISKANANQALAVIEQEFNNRNYSLVGEFDAFSEFFEEEIKNKLESGQNIMPLYVRAENPFDYENPKHIKAIDLSPQEIEDVEAGDWTTIEDTQIQESIRNAGFDGFYVKERGKKNLAVYNPNQLKSAIGNRGTYDETGRILYSLKNAPPNRYTKLAPDDPTAGKAIINAAESAFNAVKNDGTRTSARINLIDRFSGLSRTLESLPLFNDGTLRADMLHHAKAQGINLIKGGLLSGTPYVTDDGTIGINRSENNLARAAYLADRLNANQNVVESGLSGRAMVAEVARILRGADILAEDAELRQLGDRQILEAKKMSDELKKLVQQGVSSPKSVAAAQKAIDNMRRIGSANRKMNRELQVKPEDIAWARKQLDLIPEVQEVLDIWKAVNTSLVNLWEDTGLLDKETADKYRAAKNYVPLFKSREDLNEESFFRTGSGTKATAKIKKLEGADISRNIWENVDKQYAIMIAAAYENQTRRVSVEQMRGISPDLAEITNQSDPRVNLRYRDNGKDVHVIIENPNDLAAFQSMSYQLSPIMKFLGGFTNVLRAGALLNPMFWIRQLIRDPIHATIAGQSGVVTPVHSAAEFLRIITQNSEEARILASRGVIGQFDSTVTLNEFLGNVGKDKQQAPGVLQKSLHKLMQIHEASDAATRVAIFKKAKAKALKDGMSEAQAVDYAVFKARESINFALTGNSPTLANARQMIPFLNATIVGLDTLYRAATGYGLNPEEKAKARSMFRNRAMMLTAMSLAYAISMQDDEDYKKQPDYVKDANWLIPMSTETGKTFVKVSVPYEVGFLFKTLPEIFVRYLSGTSTGKESLSALRAGFIHNMPTGGVPIPQFAKPALEVVTNHSFFTNRPIEGTGDSRLPVAHRGQKASEFAKMMSGLGLDEIGMSPAKIDVLTKGYFAEFGAFFNELTDALLSVGSGKEKTPRNIENQPFMKAFLTDPQVNKAISDFYDIESNATQVANLFSKYKNEGQGDMLRAMADDSEKIKQVGGAPVMRQISSAMSDIQKAIRIIDKNQGMQPEERRERINELQKQLGMLAERGKQVANSMGLSR
jgi:hypothetical protein